MKLSKFFELQKLGCVVLRGVVYCPCHGTLLNHGEFDALVDLLREQTKELEKVKAENWELKAQLQRRGS